MDDGDDNDNSNHDVQNENSMMKMIRRIKCAVQNYAWGKHPPESAVARLCHGSELIPYAELWMGTHVKGAAVLYDEPNVLLSTYLNGQLPYLFKVLSVAKALSIQAHPHVQLAQKLHARDSQHYPDANHKPEMACAVSVFECMCGFRPFKQIMHFVAEVPDLRNIFGGETVDDLCKNPSSQTLQNMFSTWMHCPVDVVQRGLSQVMDRLEQGLSPPPGFDVNRDLDVSSLVRRLNEQYPNDPGVLAPFVLNAFSLQPGEAIFLGPNVPHAYLDGDCVECMACSDNVVRAGLTPKFRDVDTLCDMLLYEAGAPSIMTGAAQDEYTRVYTPPIDEFALSCTHLPPNTASYALSPVSSHSIVLVYSGSGTCDEQQVGTGDVYVVPANHTLELATTSERMVCYRCSEHHTS